MIWNDNHGSCVRLKTLLVQKNEDFLVAEPGFEPRQTESESVVLPLHHSAMFCSFLERQDIILYFYPDVKIKFAEIRKNFYARSATP